MYQVARCLVVAIRVIASQPCLLLRGLSSGFFTSVTWPVSTSHSLSFTNNSLALPHLTTANQPKQDTAARDRNGYAKSRAQTRSCLLCRASPVNCSVSLSTHIAPFNRLGAPERRNGGSKRG
ncbi:hypothetical protein CGRA01v4_02551 [Colletotrichum graminicola]|nr:hypothetical protein CGRA01v4_02551 [Colletotrichum graminicola]